MIGSWFARLPTVRRLMVVPGLCLAVMVALAARAIAQFLPPTISEVLVAVVLGLIAANALKLPNWTGSGVRFSVQRVLRLGIILLGARLSLGDVASIGLQSLGLVVLLMTLGLTFAIVAGRLLGLPSRLSLLIGVGTAVCGNSAIVATAPVVGADETEVSFAVATITLFGTIAVFAYPIVAIGSGMSHGVYGLWSGTAINDTSQVVAAAAALGATALSTATVVKLTRNALMAPLILGIAWFWRRGAGEAGKGARNAVPLFVFGFLSLSLLRTTGVLNADMIRLADDAAKLLILVALAGVGLNTRLASLRRLGAAPFLLGLGTACLTSVASLALISAFRLG